MVKIERISDAQALKRGLVFEGPHIAYIGREGRKMVGAGGLIWLSGVCYLWLDRVDLNRTHPVVVVRMARRMLQKAWQLGERQVIAARDEAPCSEKLLRLLGFERLQDVNGVELWQVLRP